MNENTIDEKPTEGTPGMTEDTGRTDESNTPTPESKEEQTGAQPDDNAETETPAENASPVAPVAPATPVTPEAPIPSSPAPAVKTKKKRSKLPIIIVAIVVGFMITVILSSAVFAFVYDRIRDLDNYFDSDDDFDDDSDTDTDTDTDDDSDNDSDEDTDVHNYDDYTGIGNRTIPTDDAIVYAANRTIDSIVAITTETASHSSFYGDYVTQGAGSGIIWQEFSRDGEPAGTYIVTNNHVISGASTVKVTLSNGDEYNATVKASDSLNDLAVLTVNATGLRCIEAGSSESLLIGQTVVVIGNPLGALSNSVTSGIISAPARDITIESVKRTLIQTDAAINPGNSGGGMFDLSGKLVGVVNAKSVGSTVDNIGYAIPIDTAKPVIADLISKGYVSGRPVMGISVVEVTNDSYSSVISTYPELEDYLTTPGVYIIEDNSVNYTNKSEKFKYGDRIVQIDRIEISDYSGLQATLSEHQIGDTITVTVSRISSTAFGRMVTKTYDVSVKLIEYVPAEADE